MKFGQLIKHNLSNIFLQKSYIKFGEKASPRPFYHKSKVSKVLIVRSGRGLLKYIKTNMLTTCFYLI